MLIVANLIRRFLTHELISGAGIIFVSSLAASLFNFLFNLFMTRNLSVSEYGVLASLISLMTLASLPGGAVVPMLIRFAASYFAKGDLPMVRGLFFIVIKPLIFMAFLVIIIFLVFTSSIGQFFNINNDSLIIIAGLSVSLGFIGIVNGAMLQAKLVFTFISFNNVLAAFLKFSLGVLFIFLGFGVWGAMWAMLMAFFAPYLLSFIPLKFILERGVHIPKVSLGDLFGYGAPSAIALFGITSFITTDIILVKHFFDPSQAGIYAGLSLIGRVIFFFSAPIATVMFPLITQKHTRQEKYHGIFWLSIFLVFLSSIVLTIFYFLFPEFIVRFFIKREEYLVVTGLLGLFGLFITVYSLIYIITNFYLSIKKTKVFIPIMIGAVIQAILIWFYHKTFLEVILISLIVSSLLLVFLLLYYWKLYAKKES